jgi:transcriptional regulator with XRE-family HTH domain
MERPYRDRDWLYRKYHEEGLTQREIADECGVSPTTIRRQMKAFAIETREVKAENHGLHGEKRSEEVKQKISETLSDREFSEEALRRMSEAHEGEALPKEVREKISDSLEGIPKSEETRRRMREAKTGDVDDWDHRDWTDRAYRRGFRPAKRKVHQRDEVCQLCDHDGSEHRLEVHHIVPVRLFRDVDELEFQDAHCLGNLVLLCESCHPKVEWGELQVKPDFEDIPDAHQEAYQKLWADHTEFNDANASTDTPE